MSRTLTLELPDEIARKAESVAAASRQPIESVVAGMIERAIEDPLPELLSDAAVLKLCDGQWDDSRQTELSDLLAVNRESRLNRASELRLNELMSDYRRDLVIKARAWKEAVARGLRSPLADDAT